jgi:hypothetical protein
MSNNSFFFRLLDSPIDSKGADLLQQITLQNQGAHSDKTYPANPDAFGSIPGSPFAYWTDPKIRELFKTMPRLEQDGRIARVGLSTKDDFRFLRLFWEVDSIELGKIWFDFTKGGPFSPYFCDLHLVVDWENDGIRLKAFAEQRSKEIFGTGSWSRWINSREYYFRQGLTWPSRTNGFSVRILPQNSLFSVKGPAIFVPNDDESYLLGLLAILNSSLFSSLLTLQLARTELAQSYEVGIIQQSPIPSGFKNAQEELSEIALESYKLVRVPFIHQETTHVFQLPRLISVEFSNLTEPIKASEEQERIRQKRLENLQASIDTQVTVLYGMNIGKQINTDDIASSSVITPSPEEDQQPKHEYDEDEDEDLSPVLRPSSLVSDLLMWCLGVAFSRWDVRFALEPDLLPALGSPFDPLPCCSPGMLLSPDGLPATPGNIVSEAWLRARPNVLDLPTTVNGEETIADHEYPLPIAWDGILVDDPDHPRDIVTAVRRALRLVCKDHADSLEQEACQILEVPDLRTYFRDPRLFFNYHIKRYSKSRRKAPIYWMMQSARRGYAIWLYYPRLNPDLLFRAGREYVDAKISLETERLNELQLARAGLAGTSLKAREKQVARQADLVNEVKAFGKELDRVALLEIKPDLNDGVLLNIAPLHNLVPWKEAEKAWNELAGGKYEWSSIAKQIKGKK